MACLLAVTSAAIAEPTTRTTPKPPARVHPTTVPPARFRPSWDLDGLYLWLGPTGAATRAEGAWDSTFGAHAALLRVRERAPVGLVGGMLGATQWTARSGGRLWLDAVVGTRIGGASGKMIGLTAGPLVELGGLRHPRPGAAVGVWMFLGVTPYARIGAVEGLGGFAEIGLHLSLPVVRR